MKSCRYNILWIVVGLLSFLSCKDDKNRTDVELEAYKQEQRAAFLAKEKDPAYQKWNSEAGDGFVLAKLIKKGTGKKAYFNSWVSVFYKGSLTNGTTFDQNLFEDGVPFKCAVNSNYSYLAGGYSPVIAGWGVALQHMVEGDKYEVWIPYELAYGKEGSGDKIKPYTTLIFEIELVSVDKQAAKPN